MSARSSVVLNESAVPRRYGRFIFSFPQGVEVMRLRSIGVLLLGLILASFSPATAQERFGGLEGVVKDSSAAPVPGASVTATNKTNATTHTVVTGNDGTYKILGLD